MELDHIFLLVPSGGHAAKARLAERGWVETYRRVHPGQGTANVCYALENAYLELLWLTDDDEAGHPRTRRLGLQDRAYGRERGSSPFGFAWRGPAEVETWAYRPIYLPEGESIPVAVASDDPREPLWFRSPGTEAPVDWPVQRRGELQRAAGFRRIGQPVLVRGAALGPVPRGLAELVATREGEEVGCDLPILCSDGTVRVLQLPELMWEEEHRAARGPRG